jgi:hypothetical protein
MAFDSKVHTLDQSGFMVDKETGHKVGLENKPRLAVAGEWPKWVKLHESQVERREDAPPFSKHWAKVFFNRANGEVTVLVENEEEADRAGRDISAPVSEEQKAEDGSGEVDPVA